MQQKNDIFLNFFEQMANFALQIYDNDQIDINIFLEKQFENKKISDHFIDIIAKIGENIVLKRLKLLSLENDTKIFTYTHNVYKKNIGKICVALKTKIANQNEEALQLGKNLCMHIAAQKPISIDINNLDQKLIDKEKEIQIENIKSSGKPDNILKKILEGKMKKFFSEVTFLNQQYILDEEKNC